jgi:hypothetical protein
MPLPVDRHWQAAAEVLDQILDARATADGSLPALAAEPLWPLAAGLRTALDQIARPAPLTGLRRLDDIVWSRRDELTAALGSARERAAAARQAALKHGADLEECRLAASALTPVAADAAAALRTDLIGGARALRHHGEVLLATLAGDSLGSARPRSLRGRVSRRLGRDARRSCRDHATAVRLSRRLAAGRGPALVALVESFGLTASRSADRFRGELARWQADLARFRTAHQTLCRDLAPVPTVPSEPKSLPAWESGVDALIVAAAGGSVRLFTAGDGWGLRLRTVNSVLADIGIAFGRPGYLADRTAIAGACTRVWQRAVARWSDDAVDAYDTPGYRKLLTTLDGLPKAWQRTLEQHQSTARATAAAAAAVIDRLDQAISRLSAAYQEWRAIHEDPAGSLSATTRAYLRAIAAAQRSAGRTGSPLSDLDDLGRGEPELRIPVVAPMKAGKSTLLSAVLGLDIVPRRAQVMTAVPTRFIPVPPDRQAEPRLELPEPLVASHRSLLDRLTATIGESQLAALAVNPHLQSVAGRLQRGDRVPVAAAHTGADDIRTVLTWLHDTARLATLLLPAELTDVIADWRPEVTVPVPGAPAVGRLALIDTPGPGEAEAAPVFQKIMDTQLADAHGCLIVIDFAQIFGTAEAALAGLIAGHAADYQPSATAIAVNRIDQRRDGDLDPDQVLRVARQLFDLDGWADVPVVETAAARALAALMYQRSADPGSAAELLQIAYPVRPPARPPSQEELLDIMRTVLGDSGVTELRAQLLGRVGPTLPRLAMESALARVGDQAADGVADLIAGAIWAAGMASRITRRDR